MEIVIYALIFIIGTLFGSFFTLAIYRIPLGLNILYEHSFCPNCNTKLKFKDLIPILSYITLGGKCRYCGEKVRIRYLALEVLSGCIFLLFALSIKLNVFHLHANEIIYFCFFILYFVTLFIIAGIDKEKISIQKSVLFFGLLVGVCFMIYVCISRETVIYTYIICLIAIAFILILDTRILKKNLTQNYTISILGLSMLMIVFSGVEIFYFTVALSLFLISAKLLIIRIRERAKRKAIVNTSEKNLNIPIGFFLIVSNILLIIISNFIH